MEDLVHVGSLDLLGQVDQLDQPDLQEKPVLEDLLGKEVHLELLVQLEREDQ